VRLRQLIPAEYHQSIYEIELESLRRKGIKVLLLDLDNTLVPWGERAAPETLSPWIKRVLAEGFAVCILSNNTHERGAKLAEELGIPLVSSAWKPRRRAFRQAMERLGVSARETAVIGDQIFTDVLGGNRVGAHTILVVPISRKELWSTQIVRHVERMVLRWIKGGAAGG